MNATSPASRGQNKSTPQKQHGSRCISNDGLLSQPGDTSVWIANGILSILVHYSAHKGKPVDIVLPASVCHLLPAHWVTQEGDKMKVMVLLSEALQPGL